jgi:hypothetical protein
MFAIVLCHVLVMPNRCTWRGASVQRAVKGLHLCSPELELTGCGLLITAESDFGWSVRKHIKDLAVCYIAGLVVLKHCLAAFETRHVRRTDVASVIGVFR